MRWRRRDESEPAKLTGELAVYHERLLHVLQLTAEAIPDVADRADEIRNSFGDAMRDHSDKIPRAYEIALGELKKPLKNDGIENVVSVLRSINEEIRIRSRFEQRAGERYIANRLDDPMIRPKLPALIAKMVAVLEGRQ